MCGIVGYVGPRSCVEIIISGLRKLEYRGYDSAGVAVVGAGGLGHRAREGEAEEPGAGPRRQAARRLHRHRPHALGHARPPSDENAHPHSYRRRRGRAQRHHREPPRAEGVARRRRATRSRARPTPRSSRTSSPTSWRRGHRTWPPRCAAALGQVHGDVRDRGGLVAGARTDRRRQEREPARGRLRRGRELPRQRRPGAPRAHARHDLPRGRRAGACSRRRGIAIEDRRRRAARRDAPARIDWSAVAAEKERPQALHAQGDLRAAPRGRRHAPRAHVARAGRRELRTGSS